jgi:hypothetical protein
MAAPVRPAYLGFFFAFFPVLLPPFPLFVFLFSLNSDPRLGYWEAADRLNAPLLYPVCRI